MDVRGDVKMKSAFLRERTNTWIDAIESVCDAGVPLNGPALRQFLLDIRTHLDQVEMLEEAARKAVRVRGNGQPKQLDDAVLFMDAVLKKID